jgi:hypothetical protein
MYKLRYIVGVLNKSEFKKLFGHAKTVRRYLCFDCYHEARGAVVALDNCKTAFLEEGGSSLSCAMCGNKFTVERIRCNSAECLGDVIGNYDDDDNGICHSCGNPQAPLKSEH